MRLRRRLYPLLFCLYGAFSQAQLPQQFPLPEPGNDLIGENVVVQVSADETLIDIAARYQLGYNLIRSANPAVDAWLPTDGEQVVLPYQLILPAVVRSGIVINVAEMRLFYYTKTSVSIYSISVGRGEWETPITSARVTGRVKDPVWYPPESIRAEHAARGDILPMQVPAGPDNPLGQYLLSLDIPGYFIHSTNKRFGIGMQVTHGCIRMYPENIEELIKVVNNGTRVTIINQSFKTGWQGKELYLEVHPPLETSDGKTTLSRTEIINALVQATLDYPETVFNWERIDRVISDASGLPEKVGERQGSVVETVGINEQITTL